MVCTNGKFTAHYSHTLKDLPKTLKGLMIRLSNDLTDGEQMRGQSSQNLVFVLSHGVQTCHQKSCCNVF